MIPGGHIELHQAIIVSEMVITFVAVFLKIVEYFYKK